MLAYEEGVIDSLICPFFGEGCNIVGRSKHARHFGIPNAAAGIMGYAAMASLALWGGAKPSAQRPLRSAALAGIASAAAAASAFLLWEQKAKVHAWCFWCISSAVVNWIIFPLSAVDLRSSGKHLAVRERSTTSNQHSALKATHQHQT